MSSALLRLYADVDDATGAFLRARPSAACDAGCADCCRTRPPLVSAEEADVLRSVLATRPPEVQQRVRLRARALAARLAAGEEPDFPCPLLEDDAAGVPRCLAYEGRPYACRTFGHTARVPEGSTAPVPFTCARLKPRVALAQPPPVPFRSAALREMAGVAVLRDSWMPIWLGLDPDERVERESGPASAVVVGDPRPRDARR